MSAKARSGRGRGGGGTSSARAGPRRGGGRGGGGGGRGGGGEREDVERPGVPAASAGEALVDFRERVQVAALERLERSPPVAKVAGLLQPAVRVEGPVDGLHAVVGEDEGRRLPAPEACGVVHELAAGAVDRLVDSDELVACFGGVVRGGARGGGGPAGGARGAP